MKLSALRFGGRGKFRAPRFSYLASSIDKEKGGASAKLLTLLPLWDKQ